ncbi:MAG: alpha/beta hydrolase, partial [Planctomycetales bacterium]|nr:alpha/beta hydrolase [Planctomycetales bacterium]
SLGKIGDYPGPILQSHGDCDEVVPFLFGQRLHAAAVGNAKYFHTIAGGTHNDPQPRDYYELLDSFLNRLAEN